MPDANHATPPPSSDAATRQPSKSSSPHPSDPSSPQASSKHTSEASSMHASSMHPYRRLALALAVSYLVMGAVMFARVDAWANVFLSLNQVYMAGLMVAPMLLIMLGVMGSMYPNRRLNVGLAVLGVVLIGLFWGLIRTQGGVGDRQFLRAMISHHAGAVLVCQQADLQDPRIVDLCGQIIESQRDEIRQMKALLAEQE